MQMESADLDKLTANDFQGLVGETFELAFEEGSERRPGLTLVSVWELGPSRDPSWRAPFSLLFEGGEGLRLEQRIYWLFHRQMGQLGIFLVPVGQKGNRIEYEAVFS